MEHRFDGEKLTITYDDEVCTHAGMCVRGLPAVFDADRQPWINPDGADVDQAIATVKSCPSGALQYELRA